MVGGVGVLTDFFLQIVFFATVLSIDLSRLEVSFHPLEITVFFCISSTETFIFTNLEYC